MVYSLAGIIAIMNREGGWIDLENGILILDQFVRHDDDSYEYVPTDPAGNAVDVQARPDKFLHIPAFGAGWFFQYFLRDHAVDPALLEQYGILDHMDDAFPFFSQGLHTTYSSKREEYFVWQAHILIDNTQALFLDFYQDNMDYIDIQRFGMAQVRAWCAEHNIEVIDDYVPIA